MGRRMLLLAGGLLGLGAGAAVATAEQGGELTVQDQRPFDVPVLDGIDTVGTLRVRATLGFPDAGLADRATEAGFLLREAQYAALAGFARTRVDPARAVDAAAAAAAMEQAVAAAGFPRTRVLVQSIQADSF